MVLIEQDNLDAQYNRECEETIKEQPINVIGVCFMESSDDCYTPQTGYFWTIDDEPYRQAMRNPKRQETYFSSGIHRGVKSMDAIAEDIKDMCKRNDNKILCVCEIKTRETDIAYRSSDLYSDPIDHEYKISNSKSRTTNQATEWKLIKGRDILNLTT